MKWSDLKYLAAYCFPLVAIAGFLAGGIFYWATPVFAFVLVPILEITFPVDAKNLDNEDKEQRKAHWFFDLLLYLNLPLIYGLLGYSLWMLTVSDLSVAEIGGIIFSCGFVMGSNGINVAHELGHRQDRFSRTMAKILLLPSLYTHFYIEHNFGHHLNAATPEDPATARLNQTVYSFWFTSVIRQYFSAWRIQLRLLKNEGNAFFSVKNDMLWGGIVQVCYLVLVGFIFEPYTAFYALAIAVVSFVLLESINYIEHYGLLRTKLDSGRYERVKAIHSWNSNHIMGRIMLYELTRHSDHHYRASKKYQLLDNHLESPQMPYGYPTSMVLSLCPPLWFYIMNKRIPEAMKVDPA
ncbi:alkane 1-monooxygenase [Robertkochia sediminum]|uniref:alkane 1-monooxygenase n=1 Tax=Robertkochia sediminum TaxID=2785326 RepID=UPI001931DE8D|nr:alkane 1-monooxygenase [Robertkochia sediminum]MBL7471478.1 alkane 1-monooxygenase [Robertkochia sediminum]